MTKNTDKQHILDIRYLRMARIWAENSYCERRKVGAIVVKDKMIISDGYNGTPEGLRMCARIRTILQSLMCSMPKQMPSLSWQEALIIAREQHYMSPHRHV